jgi:hypothetical protein
MGKRIVILVIGLIQPLNAVSQENSICGRIENRQLSIPSYTFHVTDENGRPLDKITREGKLVIQEGVWAGDHWAIEDHSISVPIIFDEKSKLYVSQAIPQVSISVRRKGLWIFSSRCPDRVMKLEYLFNTGNKSNGRRIDLDMGLFVFHFPNQKITSINLPDPKDDIPIIIRERGKLHGQVTESIAHNGLKNFPGANYFFVTAQGERFVIYTWNLLPEEQTLLNDSFRNKLHITLYGYIQRNPGELPYMIVSNVVK